MGIGGQIIDLVHTQLAEQGLPLGGYVLGDDVDRGHAHGLHVHGGVGAHGACALHHGDLDLRPVQSCLHAQTEGVHGGGAGAGEDRYGGGIQPLGDLHQIGQGSVVDLGIAAPEVGGFLNAAAVGHAHVHAVGVVSCLAQEALATGDGNVGDDVVTNSKAILFRLGGIAVGELAHELMADDGGGADGQGSTVEMEVGAADTRGDEVGAAVACGGGGDGELADLHGLTRACENGGFRLDMAVHNGIPFNNGLGNKRMIYFSVYTVKSLDRISAARPRVSAERGGVSR